MLESDLLVVAMPWLTGLVYCAGLNGLGRRDLLSIVLADASSQYFRDQLTLRRFASPKGDRRYEAIVPLVFQ